MEIGKTRKTPKAFRLSDDGEQLLEALARQLGVKQTAVIELAIRRMAAGEGVTLGEREPAKAA